MTFIGFSHQCLMHLVAYISSFIPTKNHDFYDVVIVRVDALGDYVIWHDAISAYQEKYKGMRILLICADIVKPLAERESVFSEVIGFNRKSEKKLRLFLQLMRRVKSFKSSIVLYPCWERHAIGDAIVHQIKSIRKVSMRSKGIPNVITQFYNRQYQSLISGDFLQSEIGAVELFTQKVISPEYKYGYSKFIAPPLVIQSIPAKRYVVVAFSASSERKSWELEKFVKVIDAIPSVYSIVLTGSGMDDVKKANRIMSLAKNKSQIVNMVNQTSVVQLVSLISLSSLVIGNDSAAVHIAAATHVKSVCVLLGAHFGRFLPYLDNLPLKEFMPICVYHEMECFRCDYHCIFKNKNPFECLKRIPADVVVDKVKELLSYELS